VTPFHRCAVLLGTIVFVATAGAAAAQRASDIDLRPHPVAPSARDPRLAQHALDTVDKLKKLFDAAKQDKVDFNSPLDLSKLKEYGFKDPKLDVAGTLKTAIELMELFNIIDPREKFLQPDYDPPGLPPLPSRAVNDNLNAKEYGEFLDMQRTINGAKRLLEHNYVVLKQTELKTKRLEDLAAAASSMSGIAGLYWATIQGNPNDPMNKSKAKFYATYDAGQKVGLDALNGALKKMAAFEERKYGDRNWYLYFGLPYYNFMVARYTRK
jgi:hypothetical protein